MDTHLLKLEEGLRGREASSGDEHKVLPTFYGSTLLHQYILLLRLHAQSTIMNPLLFLPPTFTACLELSNAIILLGKTKRQSTIVHSTIEPTYIWDSSPL
jgi:hypothetical protein